ncbi:hypothetical protein NE452_16415 [Paeniclostridium sordellii]|uniref:hypothetical protein n=1 Tax=Paraclostridium sordellii TaxID=1505 RepID=UPI0021097A53|nr:hypothetical protein [Paeniclostridium sordellii]MCQ4699111.1 hypothetical protein [Paeniclostridium sordellii]
MAIAGYIDIKCPQCREKIGIKQNSQTSGGTSVICTNCHIRVNVGFNKNGYYIKEIKST